MKKRDKIIIIGAGRSLEEIFPILKSLENNFIVKAIYDDNKKYYKKKYFGIPYKIGIKNARSEKNSKFIFAIGSYNNKNVRSKIFEKLDINKELFTNIIDPSVKIGNKTKLGYGNILYPNSIICSNSKIQNFCHLTYSVIIAHNVMIGSYTTIGSRSTVLNNTKIKDHVFIGAHVLVGENLNIGSKASLLLGSNIIRDCEPKKLYFGNPANEVNI